MGAKSIAGRAANRKQRQKMKMSRYTSSKLMIRPENIGVESGVEVKPPTRAEVRCTSCDFVARYSFLRCPSCGAVNDGRGAGAGQSQ